jgi:hypothetical protein
VKHFSMSEWADFVRGVTTEEQGASQQRHLDEGCSLCVKAVRTWKTIAEHAKQEVSYEPPSSALRIAESYFAPFKSGLKQGPGILVAMLAFDSFRQRLAVGVRGSDWNPRQLMYTCGDIVIDARIEMDPVSNRANLVGQVADSRDPAWKTEGMPVSLLSGSDTLLRTSTSDLGEFHFSFLPSEDLQVLIALKESAVAVPLPSPHVETAM